VSDLAATDFFLLVRTGGSAGGSGTSVGFSSGLLKNPVNSSMGARGGEEMRSSSGGSARALEKAFRILESIFGLCFEIRCEFKFDVLNERKGSSAKPSENTMLTSEEDVIDFFQMIYCDTLEKVFKIICRLEELSAEQQEELRRLVLRPSDVRVLVKSE
jgi:hypothetical protein